jgi:Site-specific recombinase XerD
MDTTPFKVAVTDWLELRSINRRQRTREFYRDVVDIILSHWPEPEIPCSQITAAMIIQFAKSVEHVCPSRWNTIVAALRHITGTAKSLRRRRMRHRRFTPPTQMEFSAFLAECDNIPRTKAGLVVRFLTATGLRISEARQLEWRDVLADSIHVRAEISKNGFERFVPIIPEAREVIERLRGVCKGDFVLPRQNPRKAIEKACRLAGLPRMSFHCFRHLFATRCIQSGVDLPTVARWLGHRDGGALLAKVYYHLADEHGRSMAQRVKIAA